jgi:hypothetical protein
MACFYKIFFILGDCAKRSFIFVYTFRSLKKLCCAYILQRSRYSNLPWAAKLGGGGVFRISFLRHLNLFGWSPSVLSERNRERFLRGLSGQDLMLTTHHQLVPMDLHPPLHVFMSKCLINYSQRQSNFDMHVRSEIIISVNIKINIFWHVISCKLEYRRLRFVEASTNVFKVDKRSSSFPWNANIYLPIYMESLSRKW